VADEPGPTLPTPVIVDGVKIQGSSVQDQANRVAAQIAKRTGRTKRQQWIAAEISDAGLAKDQNWDFLDAYTDHLFPGQQDGGASWPMPPVNATLAQSLATVANRVDILRTQVSKLSYQNIRIADVLVVLITVVGQLLDATNVDPPDPR
jgi:hypothetical protein